MDTSEFRRPRADTPILPSRAIYRQEPIKFFKRPKGRKGRKPKGKPLKPRGQNKAFAQIKASDEARQVKQLAVREREDREKLEIENLRIKREQLRLTDQAQQDTRRFRASQVASQTQEALNRQGLEDRRRREINRMYQIFQASFLEAERRQGESQVSMARLIADSNSRGNQVTREDFRRLQAQVTKLTPRSAGGSRPSVRTEQAQETTDITFRTARSSSRASDGGSAISPEDQAEFDRSLSEALPKATTLSPTKSIAELAEELEAESPQSGLEEGEESIGTIRKKVAEAGERVKRVKQVIGRTPKPEPEPQPEPQPKAQTPREQAESQRLARELSQERVKALTTGKGKKKKLGVKLKKQEEGTAEETQGLLSSGLFEEEDEPAPTKVEDNPYEKLQELKQSLSAKTSLSRKDRGDRFGTFRKGDTQFVVKGEIKKGLSGEFAIHTIDPFKKQGGKVKPTFVYRDLSKPYAEGKEGGFGSTSFDKLEQLQGERKVVVEQRTLAEDDYDYEGEQEDY